MFREFLFSLIDILFSTFFCKLFIINERIICETFRLGYCVNNFQSIEAEDQCQSYDWEQPRHFSQFALSSLLLIHSQSGDMSHCLIVVCSLLTLHHLVFICLKVIGSVIEVVGSIIQSTGNLIIIIKTEDVELLLYRPLVINIIT